MRWPGSRGLMALIDPVITIKTGISLVADHGTLTSCSWKRRGRSASTAGKDSEHETAWGPRQQRRRAPRQERWHWPARPDQPDRRRWLARGTAVGSGVMAPGSPDTAARHAMAIVSLNTTTSPAIAACPATATAASPATRAGPGTRVSPATAASPGTRVSPGTAMASPAIAASRGTAATGPGPATRAASRYTAMSGLATAVTGPGTTAAVRPRTAAAPDRRIRSPTMIRALRGPVPAGAVATGAAVGPSDGSPPTPSGSFPCWRSWRSAPSRRWPSG